MTDDKAAEALAAIIMRHSDTVTAMTIARDAVAAIRAGQVPGVEVGGWRPIEEAPRNGQSVLVSFFAFNDPMKGRAVSVAHFAAGSWWAEDEAQLHPPTHFRPLPTPPEAGAQ